MMAMFRFYQIRPNMICAGTFLSTTRNPQCCRGNREQTLTAVKDCCVKEGRWTKWVEERVQSWETYVLVSW